MEDGGQYSYSGSGLEHSPSPPLQAQPRSLCLAMIMPRLRTRFSYVSHSSRCCMYALYSASVPPPEKSGLSKSGGVGTAGIGRRGRGFAGAGAAWVRGFLCYSPSQSHLLAQNRCTPKKNKGMMEERARERGKKTLTTKCRPKDNVGVLGWCSTSCRVGGGWKGYGRGVEVGGEGWGEVKGGWSGREGGWKRMENFSTVSQR